MSIFTHDCNLIHIRVKSALRMLAHLPHLSLIIHYNLFSICIKNKT